MSVKYNVVPKKNPQKPEDPPRYYPVVKSSGRTSQRGLAQKGSQISTLSSVDLAAALETLLTLIPQELMEGNIVELGDFGSFRLSVKADGSDKEVDVRANNIKNVNVRFTPGKEFKLALSRIIFEKL
ncbi:MAG: HU family DNA-binding protein [Chloroflexota bacterium]